jgi:hypothetical protein
VFVNSFGSAVTAPKVFAKSRLEPGNAWLAIAVEAARSHGVETRPAEVEAFLKDMSTQTPSSDGELSEEELQSLAGGHCDGCQCAP